MIAPGPGDGPLVDRLFRSQAGRLVAFFTRRLGPEHLELAEDVVQEALLKAMQQWPYTGVPRNPVGWLFRVASNAAMDALRRRESFQLRAVEIASTIERNLRVPAGSTRSMADLPDDDELQMVLLCCHPALPREARVALSLKTLGGLSVAEIARALLSDERAVAQRLVRAKRRLREARIPFELPEGRALATRIRSALDVVYLLFNEGYGAHEGENLVRADLCREALRLGVLIGDAPAVATPESQALVALMAFHAARIPARLNAGGELVLLDDQDRSRWDPALTATGFRYLSRSMRGECETSLHIQAAIAATHAAAPSAAATDWQVILDHFDHLVAIDPSPVARLNRAVAVSRVRGASVGLEALAPLLKERSLRRYYLLPAVHADLLAATGQLAAACLAYTTALARRCSTPERRFLESRLVQLTRRTA